MRAMDAGGRGLDAESGNQALLLDWIRKKYGSWNTDRVDGSWKVKLKLIKDDTNGPWRGTEWRVVVHDRWLCGYSWWLVWAWDSCED